MAARLVATGDDLEKIALDGEAARVPAMEGWRRDLFGARALELLDGRSALAFKNRKVTVVPLD